MGRRQSPRRVGQLRIIGGRWRGRRVELSADTGVRPTGDRIRETLFNWLAPLVDGARCLDLFAGSGAIGLEALSRGARTAVFVERDAAACAQLEDAIAALGADGAHVVRGDALRFLRGTPPSERFDIAFLDPPFGAIDLTNLCTLLDDGWLADGAQIYLETGRRDALPVLPPNWTIERDKTAGQVRYMLLRRTGVAAQADGSRTP